MKRMLFVLICSIVTVNVFSQNSAALGNKLRVATTSQQTGVSINPNPVTGEEFTLQLQDLEKGKYSIFLYDEDGKKYLIKMLELNEDTYTASLPLPPKAAKGIYILQVIGKTQRFSTKMIVE